MNANATRPAASGGSAASNPVHTDASGDLPLSLYQRLHAQPRAFVPVYARRWHAYRDTARTAPIIGTKGWEL